MAAPAECAEAVSPRHAAGLSDAESFGRGLLLHVGYPKTASTWLQRRVFADVGAGFVSPWADDAVTTPGRSWALRRWLTPAPGEDVIDVVAVRERLSGAMDEALRRGRTPVLSEETLVGFIGHVGPDEALLERAAAVLPGAKVLLCVREQRAMVRSCYSQALHDGATSSLAEFLSNEPAPGVDPRRLNPAFLSYDRVVEWLYAWFGAARVCVLPFEWLRSEPARFLSTLGRFLGRDLSGVRAAGERLNPGLGPAGWGVMRRLNRVWPRRGRYELRAGRARFAACRAADALTPRSRRDALERDAGERIERFCAGVFGTSNARTARLTGLDLGGLGYDVG